MGFAQQRGWTGHPSGPEDLEGEAWGRVGCRELGLESSGALSCNSGRGPGDSAPQKDTRQQGAAPHQDHSPGSRVPSCTGGHEWLMAQGDRQLEACLAPALTQHHTGLPLSIPGPSTVTTSCQSASSPTIGSFYFLVFLCAFLEYQIIPVGRQTIAKQCKST